MVKTILSASKALNRIRWRFGAENDKPAFKLNQNDVNAINRLSEYVVETQKEIYNANKLFAKLYVYMVMKIMEQKCTTVYDNIARKQIGNILKMPLEQLIEMLTDSMNESELYDLIKDSGVVMKHPLTRTEEENEQNKGAIKNLSPEQIQEKPWKFDDVQRGIIAEINQMIELHGKS